MKVFPASPLAEHQAKVLTHRVIRPRYHEMEFESPAVAQAALPGQFVHILPPTRAGFDPLLRRAFSIYQTTQTSFKVLYRVEGRGTAALSQVQVGEQINFLGPLGHIFAYSADDIQRLGITQAILVGGGVGVPPMVFLASHLKQHLGTSSIHALIGARGESDLIGVEEFERMGISPVVTTDDGSAGRRELITVPLEEQLQRVGDSGERAVVYSCGPWPMLRAVAKLCARYDALCQVSLEENMPCGIGVCNGCVIPVQNAGDDYGQYRRVCVEGPVLWSQDVQWDKPVHTCD
jgi:dihydroorotate dehydrogenase electron transfer subunit